MINLTGNTLYKSHIIVCYYSHNDQNLKPNKLRLSIALVMAQSYFC